MSSWCMLLASCLVAALVTNSAWAEPPKPKDGPLGMKFVPLPKATFYMGWEEINKGVKTEIKANFQIAIHTVTQGPWHELMGNNPSGFSRDGEGQRHTSKDIKDEDLKHFPVENVSWNDAHAFIKKLNEKEKGKGWTYRLPTEAEWEYACRGGATTEEECSYHFYFEKPTNDLSSKEANFKGIFPFGKADKGPYLGRTTKVGSYAPNKLGLYDMHGNVWQWCEDLSDPTNPKALTRVKRGGCWVSKAAGCQSAARFEIRPDDRFLLNGFRLALFLRMEPSRIDPRSLLILLANSLSGGFLSPLAPEKPRVSPIRQQYHG